VSGALTLLLEVGKSLSANWQRPRTLRSDYCPALREATARRIQVSIALEPGADEMTSVKVGMASEAGLEKVRWLGALMRTWHLRDASSNYFQLRPTAADSHDVEITHLPRWVRLSALSPAVA
jgi:hypothetical protein